MSKALGRSLLVCLALVGIVAGAAPAAAQSACYTLTPTTTFKDLCNSPTDSQYEYYGSESNAVVSLSGTPYLLYGYPNAMRVFNVSSPMSPVETATTIGLPWSETGGTGGAITDHLRGIITLDDFPYAFTALYTLGWDFFKILPTPQFLAVGYHPSTISQQQSWLQAALFRDSSAAVYLVGQRIDAAAVSGNDRSVYIYHIGDGATLVSGISAATMANNRVMRIPLGGANDPAPYNTFNLGLGSALKYDVFSLAAKRYLLVHNLNTSQAALVDISDAVGIIAGQPVAMWTTTNTDARAWEGQWAVDGARGKLYVAASTTTMIHVFDISGAPASVPAYVAPDIPWYLDGTSAPPIAPRVWLNGDLLAVGSSLEMGYLSVGGVGGPIALPDDQVTGTGVTRIVRSCTGPYGTYASQLTPFVVGGEQYVVRSLFVWGDILHISQSCMSTTPVPNLSITPATGFPGDTFTITNTSTGSWVNPVLTLTPNVGQLTGPVGKTYTWVAPTNQSVPVQFDLSVQDANNNPYRTQDNGNTRTVTLQSNPHAAAQVTACSVSCPALQGETVTVSASLSQGHPSGFDWVVKDPNNGLTNQINVNPITVSLTAQGNYTVYAVAHYAFAATDDPNCANTDLASLNLGINNTYDSCTALAVPSEPFSVGPITVSDGITTATSTSSPTPTLQRSRAITLTAGYRLSAGYTASFVWQLTGSGAPVQRTVQPGAGEPDGWRQPRHREPCAGSVQRRRLRVPRTGGADLADERPEHGRRAADRDLHLDGAVDGDLAVLVQRRQPRVPRFPLLLGHEFDRGDRIVLGPVQRPDRSVYLGRLRDSQLRPNRNQLAIRVLDVLRHPSRDPDTHADPAPFRPGDRVRQEPIEPRGLGDVHVLAAALEGWRCADVHFRHRRERGDQLFNVHSHRRLRHHRPRLHQRRELRGSRQRNRRGNRGQRADDPECHKLLRAAFSTRCRLLVQSRAADRQPGCPLHGPFRKHPHRVVVGLR
jgi:hypothetical protein